MVAFLSSEFWPYLFLGAALQGLILGPAILSKQKTAKAKLVGYLILLYSTQLLFYISFWLQILQDLPTPVQLLNGLTFFIAPVYLFILREKPIIKKDRLHFVPFIVYVALFILNKVSPQPLYFETQVYQVSHLIFYCIWSTIIYFKMGKGKSNWASAIFISFFLYSIGFGLYHVLAWTGTLLIHHDYVISFVSMAFIYYVGYRGLFSLRFSLQSNTDKEQLSPSVISSISERMDNLMKSEERYLKSGYKLSDLSGELGLSIHILSHVINSHYGVRYNEWLNQFRVNKAKELIAHNPSRSLIEIAFESGFNNKVTFIKNFKFITGKTPGQYRESLTLLAQN